MKLSFPKLHVEAGGGSGFVVHAVLRRVHTGDIVFDKHVLHYKHTHTPWEAVVLYQPCPCQHQHAANSLWGLRSTCTPRVPLQRPDGCHPSTPAHIALLPLCLFDWTSCRRQSGAGKPSSPSPPPFSLILSQFFISFSFPPSGVCASGRHLPSHCELLLELH